MDTEEWQVWILDHLLVGGINHYVLEESLIQEAGQNFNADFYKAMEILKRDGLVALVERKGERRYGIEIDEMTRANLRSKELKAKIADRLQTTPVVPHFKDPKNCQFLGEAPVVIERKDRSVYHIYYRKNDRHDYVVRKWDASRTHYRDYPIGSLNDRNSVISKAWRLIQDIASKNGGVFILQDLVDHAKDITGTNKLRGHAIIVVLLREGYIKIDSIVGNSVNYRLSGTDPHPVTLKDFGVKLEEKTEDNGDFPETWDEEGTELTSEEKKDDKKN